MAEKNTKLNILLIVFIVCLIIIVLFLNSASKDDLDIQDNTITTEKEQQPEPVKTQKGDYGPNTTSSTDQLIYDLMNSFGWLFPFLLLLPIVLSVFLGVMKGGRRYRRRR